MKLDKTRILGIIGMLGAPWIFIDFIENGLYDRFAMTSTSGIYNFAFITGWTCSVIGLYRLEAMGNQKWARVIIIIQLIFLFLANIWNIYEIIEPSSQSQFFYVLNFAWPISGFFMLLTGLTIVRANKLGAWKRFIPLSAGLWFPFMLIVNSLGISTFAGLLIAGIYATVVFTLLGLSIVSSTYEPAITRRTKIRPS
jgi:hypothetical protein